MKKNDRFKVGDLAIIVRGPEAPMTELDASDPDRYHYLLKGSLVKIRNCHSWPSHEEWGQQYTVEPLDDDAWSDPNQGDQGTQYVYDLHIVPAVTINTADINEVEKFLAHE